MPTTEWQAFVLHSPTLQRGPVWRPTHDLLQQHPPALMAERTVSNCFCPKWLCLIWLLWNWLLNVSRCHKHLSVLMRNYLEREKVVSDKNTPWNGSETWDCCQRFLDDSNLWFFQSQPKHSASRLRRRWLAPGTVGQPITVPHVETNSCLHSHSCPWSI